MDEANKDRWREVGFWAAVVLSATGLTLYAFRPHLGELTDRLLGPHNDVIQSSWMLRAQWEALLELRWGEIFDAPSMYPEAPALAFGDTLFIQMLIGLPVAAAGEPVLAVNVAVLSTYLLCAVFAAGFVRSLTGSRAIALCVGLCFAFFPKRLQNFYHLNNLAFMWCPLAAWALVAWYRSRSWRWIAVGAAALYLQFLSSIQLTFHLCLLLGLWAVALWGQRSPTGSRTAGRRFAVCGRELRQVLAAAAGLGFLLVPWSMLYAKTRAALPGSRATDAMFYYRAHLADYAAALFPGWVLLTGLLVALGLGIARLWPRCRDRFAPPGANHLWILLAIIAAALALSFGPYTRIDGDVVPLPYYGLMRLVPIFGTLRVPHRLLRVAMVLVSGAAGIGLLWLALLLRRWLGRFSAPSVAAVAIAGLVATMGPIKPGTRTPPRAPIVEAIRQRLPASAVIFPVPLGTHHGQRPQLDHLAQEYDRATVGGYNQGIPALFPVLRRFTDRFPQPSAVTAIRAVGASHVLVNRQRLSPQQRLDIEAASLPLCASDSTWQVYDLGPSRVAGFDPFSHAELTLAGPSRAPAGQRVTFALWPNIGHTAIDRTVRRPIVVAAIGETGTKLSARATLESPSVIAPGAAPYRVSFTTPSRPGRWRIEIPWPVGDSLATDLMIVEQLPTSAEGPLRQVIGGGLVLPDPIYAGGYFPVRLTLRNIGHELWLATSDQDLPANQGAVVLDAAFTGPKQHGRRYQPAHGFVALPHDLAPGDQTEISAWIEAPPVPGSYTLRLSLASQHHTRPHQGLLLDASPVMVR